MEKIRTSREASRTVACPTCGAAPGEPCRREADTPSHSARHEAAVDAGAPLATRPASQGDAAGGDGATAAA